MQNILIVDNESSNIAILQSILQPYYEIFVAKSGVECLSRLEVPPTIHIILLDIRMPFMDGYEVCQKLKNNPQTEHIPVIFVTAADEAESETKGFEIGGVDYIKRPFQPTVVKSRINNQLELAKVRQHSENRYKALFTNMADGIVINDLANNIVEANTSFCNTIRYTRDQLLSMSYSEIDRETERNGQELRNKNIQHEKQAIYETQHQRRDGLLIPVEVNARLIDFDSHPAILSICRDITTRKKAEEERNNYRLQLERMMAERETELRQKEKSLETLERVLDKRKRFQNIVGKSEVMQALYTRLESLAKVPSTVIISGESGTGKELVAQALHYGGDRKNLPFMKISCSDLSENLIESELFGHKHGAFSGAIKDRKGRFELAGNGTVFLDEIGDIPSTFQKRLLRVLEEKKIERVGESLPIPMKARIVSATHHNLAEMVEKGQFRADLYYRLKVVLISLPALRERKEDIPLLIKHFLIIFSEELQKPLTRVSTDAMKALMAHSWPGNIRELKHVIEYASVTSATDIISINDLPSDVFTVRNKSIDSDNTTTNEIDKIVSALKKAKWNKTEAAKILGVSRRTFYRRFQKYSIAKLDT